VATIAKACFWPIALRPAFSGRLPLSIFVNGVIQFLSNNPQGLPFNIFIIEYNFLYKKYTIQLNEIPLNYIKLFYYEIYDDPENTIMYEIA